MYMGQVNTWTYSNDDSRPDLTGHWFGPISSYLFMVLFANTARQLAIVVWLADLRMSVLNLPTRAPSIESMSLSSLWSHPTLRDSAAFITFSVGDFSSLAWVYSARVPRSRGDGHRGGTISRLVLAPQGLTRYLVDVNQTESQLGSSMNGRSCVFFWNINISLYLEAANVDEVSRRSLVMSAPHLQVDFWAEI